MLKTIVILMLSTFALSTGASGCHAKQSGALPIQTPNSGTSTNAMKVLAEGFHSSITNPFIAVIRDAETYAELRKLDNNLPKLDAEFFNSKAVIAAYLGTRNTGGYSVEIRREGTPGVNYPSPDRSVIHIAEKAPGKDVMVPQMITSPFKIVSIPVDGVPALVLAIDLAWRKKQQLYRVSSGSFTMSGGFTGTSEQFVPHGEFLVMRASSLVSFYISLAARGATKERFLADFATGIVQSNDQITINRLSAGSFVSAPNSGLKATGTFAAEDHTISLNFNSLPTMIADGYSGSGTIEATLVDSPPKP